MIGRTCWQDLLAGSVGKTCWQDPLAKNREYLNLGLTKHCPVPEEGQEGEGRAGEGRAGGRRAEGQE